MLKGKLRAFESFSFIATFNPSVMRTPAHLRKPGGEASSQPRRFAHPPPAPKPYHATRRIVFNDHTLSIFAYPSRGGVIVFEHATALDFEFLGLDSTNLCMWRDHNQDDEDALCQRLLLLGAHWYDSEDRMAFISELIENPQPGEDAIKAGTQPGPSIMERTWVSVAFPNGPEGGFWVLELDSGMWGYPRPSPSYKQPLEEREKNYKPIRPGHAAMIRLAKDVGAKCEIMKGLGARFYESLEQYDGVASLNAWMEKTHGEFGPLVPTRPMWPKDEGH